MRITNKWSICVIMLMTCSCLNVSGQEGTQKVTKRETLTLYQIIDSAKANNINIRNAQQSIKAAEEQRKEAFTKYFPNVSATGLWFNANRSMTQMDVNLSESMPPTLAASLAQALPPEALVELGAPVSVEMMKNGTLAGVSAVQPVFAGGKIVNGNRLAKVGEEVSVLQMKLAENEVELTAEQYFWQIVALEEKMNTVLAVEEWLNDICKDVNTAVEAGVAMKNDLLQVQLKQNEVESQKLKLGNGIGIMKMLLAHHCGLNDTAFVLHYDPDDIPLPSSLKRDPDAALEKTTEYQLLNKQVEAATLQKKMAIGDNMPTVAVGAGYNYHNLLGNDRTFAMVFATVNIPISSWWGGSHAVKRKEIEQQKAIDQLADNSELLIIKMQKGWNDVVEAYQQLGIAQRSIEQAKENLRLQSDYYKAGISTMSNLLEAQTLYQQSLDKHTDAVADYHNKILVYKQAVGY